MSGKRNPLDLNRFRLPDRFCLILKINLRNTHMRFDVLEGWAKDQNQVSYCVLLDWCFISYQMFAHLIHIRAPYPR